MKQVMVLLFLLMSLGCYPQFHIGDTPEQVMVDVLQNKWASEPVILDTDPKCVYWEESNISATCAAYFKEDRKVFKLTLSTSDRNVFTLFVKQYNKQFLVNGPNEWFASINEKAYLVKAYYFPSGSTKYSISFTKL